MGRIVRPAAPLPHKYCAERGKTRVMWGPLGSRRTGYWSVVPCHPGLPRERSQATSSCFATDRNGLAVARANPNRLLGSRLGAPGEPVPPSSLPRLSGGLPDLATVRDLEPIRLKVVPTLKPSVTAPSRCSVLRGEPLRSNHLGVSFFEPKLSDRATVQRRCCLVAAWDLANIRGPTRPRQRVVTN